MYWASWWEHRFGWPSVSLIHLPWHAGMAIAWNLVFLPVAPSPLHLNFDFLLANRDVRWSSMVSLSSSLSTSFSRLLSNVELLSSLSRCVMNASKSHFVVIRSPISRSLYEGSFRQAFVALITSNSTQYLNGMMKGTMDKKISRVEEFFWLKKVWDCFDRWKGFMKKLKSCRKRTYENIQLNK